MTGEPDANGRAWRRLDLRARLKGCLAAVLVVSMKRQQMPVVRPDRNGVMVEQGSRGARRSIAVVRGRMLHHVLERNLGSALALELVDAIDRGERAADI